MKDTKKDTKFLGGTFQLFPRSGAVLLKCNHITGTSSVETRTRDQKEKMIPISYRFTEGR